MHTLGCRWLHSSDVEYCSDARALYCPAIIHVVQYILHLPKQADHTNVRPHTNVNTWHSLMYKWNDESVRKQYSPRHLFVYTSSLLQSWHHTATSYDHNLELSIQPRLHKDRTDPTKSIACMCRIGHSCELGCGHQKSACNGWFTWQHFIHGMHVCTPHGRRHLYLIQALKNGPEYVAIRKSTGMGAGRRLLVVVVSPRGWSCVTTSISCPRQSRLFHPFLLYVYSKLSGNREHAYQLRIYVHMRCWSISIHEQSHGLSL